MQIRNLFSCLKGNRLLEFIKENSLVFHSPGETPAHAESGADAGREAREA